MFKKLKSIKVFVIATLLCLVIREEFPFSNFPMYGSFSNYTYYVYVTGEDGLPLPLKKLTGVRSANLKKIYDAKIKVLRSETKKRTGDWRGTAALSDEERRPLGEDTLGWLRQNSKDPAALASVGELTFHHVGLTIKNGKIVSDDDAVASLK
ncbi:hypothetical protein OAF27_02900 [Verrucomicrobiales bacterium]|nr:hypothetical protein [Verrucomicrobiales bacterium]